MIAPQSAIEPSTLPTREAALLASYATHSTDTGGRRYPEPSHPYRGPFQRDRDRIVHSSAFRRLSHKTQVFTGELGDYHRSRLTHTLECSSIARTVARSLRLNEDLVEALALAHDIGHPPFGHAGEYVLDHCLQHHGGFNHNAQALRLVEQLETRYAGFPGLNLSLEVLEGQRTRVDKQAPGPSPRLESQVVDAADSAAYDTHDADDALVLGLLKLADLEREPLWREAARRVRQRYSALEATELRRAVVHEMVDWQVSDLLETTRQRIVANHIETIEQVRRAAPLALPSSEMAELKRQFEVVLKDRVYRHPQVLRVRDRVQAHLEAAFQYYLSRPDQLPDESQQRIAADGVHRTVADYLACLTDRAASSEFERLLGGE
ncbi:MAG: dNTP triphosphohydrolase [Pirellulales bacterium]|nr:dNTP triphosphohydrolase [Pirellulales bacterium]